MSHTRAENFPDWYQEILTKAELSENGPVRGTMVIRPYAYGIWENMQRLVDTRIQAAGAENAYFPLFIPMSLLNKEADHVAGFKPELAVVTHGGGSELAEPLAIRPTSETIIGEFMKKWIQSYRDLPLLLNQWANVVRWEKRPRAFLRTTEFLWQEGHTAHRTEADAAAYASKILYDVYRDFMVNELAIDVLPGSKPASERFAGATNTLTVEAMMGDGKALQMGTSHELGQNFANAAGIWFTDEDGEQRLVWTASWGVSTRMMGGLIMVHGDDLGLRVPPRVAAIQVVILPTKDEPDVRSRADEVAAALTKANVRVRQDLRTEKSLGKRRADWELKGVPIRLEIGPREVAEGTISVVRRDTGETLTIGIDGIGSEIDALLTSIQGNLLAASAELRASLTTEVSTLDEGIEAASDGWAILPWALVQGREDYLKETSDAVTVRCILNADGSLPANEAEEAGALAVIGRSY